MADQEQETIYEPNIRWERRQARLALLKESKSGRPERVRVHPRDEIVRRDIKHGANKRGFPMEGSVEWPFDQFTKRRLRDGTVRLESAEETQARNEQRAKDRGGRRENGSPRDNGSKDNKEQTSS